MSGWSATMAKFVGAGLVAAIPLGLLLGSFTTGNMRRDYSFGFAMPRQGVEAATPDVPYTVPEKIDMANAPAIYPAPPPSAIGEDDAGDGFDDEAYLASYDRERRAVVEGSDYADRYGGDDFYAVDRGYEEDYDTVAEPGYRGERDDRPRGWERELRGAGSQIDDPFVAQAERRPPVRRSERRVGGGGANDATRYPAVTENTVQAEYAGRPPAPAPRRTGVTVTRGTRSIDVSAPAGSPRSAGPVDRREDYLSPIH